MSTFLKKKRKNNKGEKEKEKKRKEKKKKKDFKSVFGGLFEYDSEWMLGGCLGIGIISALPREMKPVARNVNFYKKWWEDWGGNLILEMVFSATFAKKEKRRKRKKKKVRFSGDSLNMIRNGLLRGRRRNIKDDIGRENIWRDSSLTVGRLKCAIMETCMSSLFVSIQ